MTYSPDGRFFTDAQPSHKRMTQHATNILRTVREYTRDGGQLFCWICKATPPKAQIVVINPAPVLCTRCLPRFVEGLLYAMEEMTKLANDAKEMERIAAEEGIGTELADQLDSIAKESDDDGQL